MRGWVSYYRLLRSGSKLKALDGWIRRKIRVVKLKQLKRRYTVWKFLVSRGVSHENAWLQALSGKGYWRLSRTPQSHRSMNQAWFDELGLETLHERWSAYRRP
ncbi:group II intron maturase-specific domain-containing protein [Desulfoplanes sp. PS50]